MKAVLGELPSGEGWGFELKWDGMRLAAACTPGQPVELRSLSGRDVTSSFPELAALPDALAIDAVLDGEAVVFDGDRPSFGRLQQRMHVEAPTQQLVTSHPVVYVVFDLVALDGHSLVGLPLRDRRRLLADVVDDGPSWRVSPMADHGEALLALAEERHLEGVVAKRLDSLYEAGGRSRSWVKVKLRRRQEFVVVGWLAGQGVLAGAIGSLLLAVWDDDRLVYAGAVGSGIGEADRVALSATMVPADRPALAVVPSLDRDPHWIEPDVVVEVAYGSWPADASLRHPVYAGLRTDRDPIDVVRELPP